MKRRSVKANRPAPAELAAVTARLSATVDPNVLAEAKAFARLSGFTHSFSAYLNDVLVRDNKQRSQLLNAPRLPSQSN